MFPKDDVMNANDDALPPLPEPQKECWIGHTMFSADQMRDYARAAIRALSADRGEAVGYPVACNWPPNPFTVRDEPGEHDPCWLVMPDGGMLRFVHHATNGVDQARAQFLADACNAYAATPPSPAESATPQRTEPQGERFTQVRPRHFPEYGWREVTAYEMPLIDEKYPAENWERRYTTPQRTEPGAVTDARIEKFHALLNLLRQPEVSDEPPSEHDLGYEQASAEIANHIEAILANPAQGKREDGNG